MWILLFTIRYSLSVGGGFTDHYITFSTSHEVVSIAKYTKKGKRIDLNEDN